MADYSYLAGLRIYAAAATWIVEISNSVDSISHSDGGTINQRPAAGTGNFTAKATQHRNAVTIGNMLLAGAEELLTRRKGTLLVVDDDNDCWFGGPYTLPSDQATTPTSDFLVSALAFGQGPGKWWDGGPAQSSTTEVDRVVALDLGARDNAPTGLRVDAASDRAMLALTTSATCTFRVASDANRAPTAPINLTTGSRLVDVGALSGLGSGRLTNVTLDIAGLSGQEKLEGWLLIGRHQTVDRA